MYKTWNCSRFTGIRGPFLFQLYMNCCKSWYGNVDRQAEREDRGGMEIREWPPFRDFHSVDVQWAWRSCASIQISVPIQITVLIYERWSDANEFISTWLHLVFAISTSHVLWHPPFFQITVLIYGRQVRSKWMYFNMDSSCACNQLYYGTCCPMSLKELCADPNSCSDLWKDGQIQMTNFSMASSRVCYQLFMYFVLAPLRYIIADFWISYITSFGDIAVKSIIWR
jgi:hypothetical protein